MNVSSRTGLILFIIAAAMLWTSFLKSETVDGVAASVNHEIITLTDIRIVQTFQLFENMNEDMSRASGLQALIERKLLIQLAGQEGSVNETKVEAYLSNLKKRMGEDEFQRQLQRFGMTAEDFRVYAEEAVLHRLILAERFSQAVVVSLREMEDYYREVYIPSRNEKQKPRAMMDMLDEIEEAIRQEKIKSRVEEWLANLKKQSEIRVYTAEYPEFFSRQEK